MIGLQTAALAAKEDGRRPCGTCRGERRVVRLGLVHPCGSCDGEGVVAC